MHYRTALFCQFCVSKCLTAGLCVVRRILRKKHVELAGYKLELCECGYTVFEHLALQAAIEHCEYMLFEAKAAGYVKEHVRRVQWDLSRRYPQIGNERDIEKWRRDQYSERLDILKRERKQAIANILVENKKQIEDRFLNGLSSRSIAAAREGLQSGKWSTKHLRRKYRATVDAFIEEWLAGDINKEINDLLDSPAEKKLTQGAVHYGYFV